MSAATSLPLAEAAPPPVDAEAYRAKHRAWLAANLPARWRADNPDYQAPTLDEAQGLGGGAAPRRASGASPGPPPMAATA